MVKTTILKTSLALGTALGLILLFLGGLTTASQLPQGTPFQSVQEESPKVVNLLPDKQEVVTPTDWRLDSVLQPIPPITNPGRQPLPGWVQQLQKGGIHAAANIAIAKSVTTQSDPNGAIVPNGEFINYFITVTNTGSTAVSLTVIDPLPRDDEGNVQVGKEISINQCGNGSPPNICGVTVEDKSENYRTSDGLIQTAIITAPDTLTWFVASLAGGSSQTLQFTVVVDCQSDGSIIKNRAFFTGPESGSSNQVQTTVQGSLPKNGQPALSSAPTSCSHPQETANRLSAGDFDRDGDLDVALASVIGMTIFRNSGQGEFALIPPFHEDLLTEDVVWADFNNDGDLEVLAVGDWGNGPTPVPGNQYSYVGFNYIYEYNGTNFQLLKTGDRTYSFQSNDSVVRAAAADYNGDGYLDLATASYWGGCSLLLYKNLGPSFTVPFSPTLGFPSNNLNCLINTSAETTLRATSVAWGDVNSDGTPDLAAGAGNGPFQGQSPPYWLRVYQNAGTNLSSSSFITVADNIPSSVYDLAWGDYTQDGFLDLAAALYNGTILVFANQGGTSFATGVPISPQGGQGAAIDWADLNKDGRLDLVTARSNGRIRTYDGASLTEISQLRPATRIEGTVYGVRSFDADNDGDLDVIAANQNGPSVIFSGYVPPLVRQISPLTPPEADWRTDSLDWGDVDGDGDLDLLFGASSGKFGSWLYKNNQGKLSLSKTLVSGPGPQSVTLADSDKDGDLDAAISTVDEHQLHPNAGGTLQSPNWFVSAPATTIKRSLAWADADDDGDLDLMVGQKGQNLLFRNDATQLTLSPIYSTPQSDDTRSVAWFDYNKDFFLDFAAGNYGGQTRLYRNSQGKTFILDASLPVSYNTTSIAWGDWDQDGEAELALGNYDQPNHIYKRQGNATWASVWQSDEIFRTTSVAWGDWNNDGDLDLAVGNDGQPDQIYENLLAESGEANLVWRWASNESNLTTGVAWGDIDNDGDLDLAVSQGGGGQNGVYLNSYVSPSHLVATTELSKTKPLPNNPSYLSIPRPGTTENAYFFSSPEILAGPNAPTIPIAFTLFDPEVDDIIPLTDANTLFQYSLDGAQWRTATGVITGSGSDFTRTSLQGQPYTFLWNAGTDKALSDEAQFRIRVINHLGSLNQPIPAPPIRRAGLSQRGYISAISPPFRVRALTCFWPDNPMIQTTSPYSRNVPLQFKGAIEQGSGPITFTWNFGNVITNGQVTQHTFTANGTYSVVMTVTGAACPIARSLVTTQSVVIGTGVPDKLTYLPWIQKTGVATTAVELPALTDFELNIVPGAPDQILNLSGSFQAGGPTHLAWQSNPITNQILGYRVYRSLQGSSAFKRLADLPATVTSYTDTGITCGAAYFVTAYNQAGESLPSTSSYFTWPCQ
jgi:hypothetical protein